MATTRARCEQSANKLPIITAGTLTPEAVRSWEKGCKQYFLIKKIDAAQQVPYVAWNLQDARIHEWYDNDSDRLDKLSFADFVADLRKVWLPSDWDDTLREKMLCNVQGSRAFHDWAVEVENQNTMLKGTPSHLQLASLRWHLEAHMCLDLKRKYRVSGEKAEKDFRTWLDKVRLLDEERQHDVRRTTRVCEDVVRQTGRFPCMPTGSNSSAGPSSNPLKDLSMLIRLPVLTAEERALLNAHRGCYKCRWFYQPHGACDCPNGFPDGKGYKTLTEADAQAVVTKAPKHLGKPKAVAVVNDSDEDTSVSVVMPSAVLGNGTDSEEECIAPLSVPHLKWSCLINGPSVSSPILVKALIDHGSTVVLIDQTLVTQLGLC
jgi:hypothetical protein